MRKIYSILGIIHFLSASSIIIGSINQKDRLGFMVGIALGITNISMLIIRDRLFKERKDEDGQNE